MGSVEDDGVLRHLVVVGGSRAEWDALTAAQWLHRLEGLGKLGDRCRASWVTVRPFPTDNDAPDAAHERRTLTAGSCVVTADSESDGRQRLVDAANRLRAQGIAITEAALAPILNEPAQTEPDLVVILGRPQRLPRSLVWELAYSELVFVDVSWAALEADHVARAVEEFTGRHRRFGGLD